MPELSFQLNPFFLQALREIIEPINERFRLAVAVSLEGAPDDDDLLLDAWRESLLEQLRADVEQLIALIGKMGPGEVISLSESEAESAMRAAAAIRLKIREVFLSDIPSRALERGGIDIARLSPEQQKPFACYNFLAAFQETLCAQLMPDFYDDWDDE